MDFVVGKFRPKLSGQRFVKQNAHPEPVLHEQAQVRQSLVRASRMETNPKTRPGNRQLRDSQTSFSPELAYQKTPASRPEFQDRCVWQAVSWKPLRSSTYHYGCLSLRGYLCSYIRAKRP